MTENAPDSDSTPTRCAVPDSSGTGGHAIAELPGYELVDFAALSPVACPCGQARRALADVPDFPGTIHVTDISADAQLHYHRRLTEVYYFLHCEPESRMQLNDQLLPVSPGMCILIRPGTRHRALGRMRVLIVVMPKFDPADEWFD
jgi:mannose-6-phosphate isomerase-like protein (cupin superfamily)